MNKGPNLCTRCGLHRPRKNNTVCYRCVRSNLPFAKPGIARPDSLITTGVIVLDACGVIELPFGYSATAPAVGKFWFDHNDANGRGDVRLPILQDSHQVPEFIQNLRHEVEEDEADRMWSIVWRVFELGRGRATPLELQAAALYIAPDNRTANECLDYTIRLLRDLGVLQVIDGVFDVAVIRESAPINNENNEQAL